MSQMWRADPTLGYRLVTLASPCEKGLRVDATGMVEIVDGGERRSIRSNELFPRNPDDQDGVADNCTLMHLHEAALLHNLQHRYEQHAIYTYTAMILIAVNPYRRLPALYDEMDTYRDQAIGHSPPHVYALADRAHRMLRRERKSQTFVISGESGSGKTENAKYIMQFLGQVSCAARSASDDDRAVCDVGALIIDANPILEAVGNAKTARNNNSSRFGKFVQMHFDDHNALTGATIQTYLLETSRLVHQDTADRNYHIFYQLIGGLSAVERAHIGLDETPDAYHYLRQSGCTSIHERNDAAECAGLRRAMERMGIPSAAQLATFAVLAALLRLGNVAFHTGESAEGSAIADDGVLRAAAEALGLGCDDLSRALRFRQVAVGGRTGEPMLVALDVHAAAHARDALAKDLYARVFRTLVAQINARTALAAGSVAFIGVLDIFGFESFVHNSFEQLCINFANERFQQYFNDQVLRQEHEIYASEGLRVLPVEFVDNQDCIDLFMAAPGGIFATLEDERNIPKASDRTFTEKVYMRHKHCPRLSPPRATKGVGLTRTDGFVIRHFAGEVVYSSHGFLDKNTDSLHASLDALIRSSSHPHVQSLFALDDTVVDRSPAPKPARKTNAGRPPPTTTVKTVSGKFTRQLAQLMDVLQATSSHFIRCIKPNDSQRPGDFAGPKVLAQLRCAGMLEAVRILNAGFPTRCALDEIVTRYATAMPEPIRSLDAVTFSHALLRCVGLRRADYQMGRTRVFFRAGKRALLDELAAQWVDGECPAAMVAQIQSWLRRRTLKRCLYTVYSVVKWRACLRRRRALERFVRTARVLRIVGMTGVRMLRRARARLLARHHARCVRLGVVQLQAHIRRKHVSGWFGAQRGSALTIQRLMRGRLARKGTSSLLQAARMQRTAAARHDHHHNHPPGLAELWRMVSEQRAWQHQRDAHWQQQLESLRAQLDEERLVRKRLYLMFNSTRRSHARTTTDGHADHPSQPIGDGTTRAVASVDRHTPHVERGADAMDIGLRRIHSFRGYTPKGALSATRLAAAGFSFSPSAKHSDRAVCFACHVAIHSWDADDDPLQEHLRWSPLCTFAHHLASAPRSGPTTTERA